MTPNVLKTLSTAALLGAFSTLAACKTTAPQQQQVVIPPQMLQTCTPMSALQKVVIPPVTKTFYATTEIANPPYEPIQRTEKQVREIEPARIIFVNSMNQEVIDICENNTGTYQPMTQVPYGK